MKPRTNDTEFGGLSVLSDEPRVARQYVAPTLTEHGDVVQRTLGTPMLSGEIIAGRHNGEEA